MNKCQSLSHFSSCVSSIFKYFRLGISLQACLLQIVGYRNLIADVEKLRREPYDSDNPQHEEMLLQVCPWTHFSPSLRSADVCQTLSRSWHCWESRGGGRGVGGYVQVQRWMTYEHCNWLLELTFLAGSNIRGKFFIRKFMQEVKCKASFLLWPEKAAEEISGLSHLAQG